MELVPEPDANVLPLLIHTFEQSESGRNDQSFPIMHTIFVETTTKGIKGHWDVVAIWSMCQNSRRKYQRADYEQLD